MQVYKITWPGEAGRRMAGCVSLHKTKEDVLAYAEDFYDSFIMQYEPVDIQALDALLIGGIATQLITLPNDGDIARNWKDAGSFEIFPAGAKPEKVLRQRVRDEVDAAIVLWPVPIDLPFVKASTAEGTRPDFTEQLQKGEGVSQQDLISAAMAILRRSAKKGNAHARNLLGTFSPRSHSQPGGV